MKNTTIPTEDHKFSIMQRILDGTVTITSPEEFKDILGIYPQDPFLHRKYADLLLDLKRPTEAFPSYETAARLFIERGMSLQAIVAKILQWHVQKPSHDEGRRFYAMLHEEGSRQTPLQRFWARMSYAELVAVMRRLVRVRLPARKKITRADEPADQIYFVVSGTLWEMPSPDCASEAQRDGIEIEPVLLGPNDIFGDIFPLDRPTVADAEIHTVTEVELVRISKEVLSSVCKKYPQVQSLLQEIHKSENRQNCDRSWQTVRRAMRFGLPTRVAIRCPVTSAAQAQWQHSGIAVDLSMSGMCVDLGVAPATAPRLNLRGRLAHIKLDLLNDVAVLKLTGKIVWQRQQKSPKGSTTLIGIRFDTLSAMDREMLSEYCSGSVGEQNLLWSLWDSMVKTENSH
ncbi:MAG: PilZ domain-containing protein [Desulfatitalea sp.]